jgi:RND family efflux transporter MFP subunit
VQKDEVLARLDEGTLRNAIRSAEAEVTNARNALAVASKDQARSEELSKIGATSRRELDAGRQGTVAARARLAQAQAALASEKERLAYSKVLAPLAGVVSEKQVSSGDFVQPGSALYTVVDPSSLELEAAVAAEQLASIRIGVPVEFTVTGYPDRSFEGTITRINPTADPLTRQIRVYAELPNDAGRLVAGLFAEGRVASESRVTLTVPSAAIDRRLGRPAVVRVRGGKVERVDVELGLQDERSEMVEIRSGVAPGETLLMGAAQALDEGTHVRLQGEAGARELALAPGR